MVGARGQPTVKWEDCTRVRERKGREEIERIRAWKERK